MHRNTLLLTTKQISNIIKYMKHLNIRERKSLPINTTVILYDHVVFTLLDRHDTDTLKDDSGCVDRVIAIGTFTILLLVLLISTVVAAILIYKVA